MPKPQEKQFLFIGICLLVLLTLPLAVSERLRESTLGLFAWKLGRRSTSETVLLQRLELENQLLKEGIQTLKKQFYQKESLGEERVLPARVVMRGPNSWSSHFWIDRGISDGFDDQGMIIQKNSPVMYGSSLIGIVDQVGEHRSRVRLISDHSLSPSVRATRGQEQDTELLRHIEAIEDALVARKDLFPNQEDLDVLTQNLDIIRQRLELQDRNWYLAKGELQGDSHPLWKSSGSFLRGTGFNYDFADSEGPARDLRTGKPYGAPPSDPGIALIKEGDLLVTTGLDGVFPPGLAVATVSTVFPLREGSYFYEIIAQPAAGSLHHIDQVLILPPYASAKMEIP